MSYEVLTRLAPETDADRLNDERREGRMLYDTSQMRLTPTRAVPLVCEHDLSREIGTVT